MARRHWFWRLCLVTFLGTIIIAAALMMLLQGSSITSLQSSIDAHHYHLTAIRLAVIGLITLSWPRLIRHAEHKGHIGIDRSVELTALRWRVLAWLLVIELLIGQNLMWWLLESPNGNSA